MREKRGAGAGLTQDSNSKELDTFVISQISYNRVLTDRMFLDAKASYNNTHFPLAQKTNLQAITDNTTQILYRNRQSTQEMFRRRVQVVSNWQYFLPKLFGGRHDFRFAPTENGQRPFGRAFDPTTHRGVDDRHPLRRGALGHPMQFRQGNGATD